MGKEENKEKSSFNLEKYLLDKNSKLISFDGKSTSKFRFKCTKCDNEGEIGYKNHFYLKQNPDLLCRDCLKKQIKEKKYNESFHSRIEELRIHLSERGSELIEFDGRTNSKFKFKCIKCGKIGEVNYYNYFNKNCNNDLLCNDCLRNNLTPELQKRVNDLKQYLEEKGSKLIEGSFNGKKTSKFKFKCSKCGNVGEIEYREHFYKKHSNPYLLCKECLRKDTTNRIQETFIKNYGTNKLMLIEDIMNKYKQTCLKKYGVEYITQDKNFKEKCKQTKIDKYGVDSYSKTDEFKNKIRQTNLERYGVENAIQNSEIKERLKQTNLKKYGKEWYTQTDEFKEKQKKTNLERYGAKNASSNQEIKDKK